MEDAVVREHGTMAPEACRLEQERRVQEDRWHSIHRMAGWERLSIAEIARRLDLDHKTFRRCLSQKAWQPYQRPARTDTLFVEHAEFLRERAPHVNGHRNLPTRGQRKLPTPGEQLKASVAAWTSPAVSLPLSR